MSRGEFTKFVKSIVERVKDVRATELAAQLAYYFLLSLFPFLIFVVTLLPILGFTGEEFVELLRPYVPDEAMQIVDDNLNAIFGSKKGGLLSFGIIATIWSASNAINGIIRGLNHAYEVEESRSFFVIRLLAILLTLGMIIVIVVALVLPVFGKMIGQFLTTYLGLTEGFLVAWEVTRWILSYAIISFVITFIYYIAPNKRLEFKEVIIGGVFATIGWLLSSLGFSYYVTNFGNYSATYGSLGGVIILMIWFYVSAFIIILGGILNVVIHRYRMSK